MNRRFPWALLVTAALMVGCSRAAASPVAKPEPPPVQQPQPAPPAPAPEPTPPKWQVTADNLASVAAQYHPNEAGRVLILEYHSFGAKEERWTRTFDNFQNDLQTLYDQGFRTVNLKTYIDGKFDLPVGTSPVVFTFDDALKSQFHLEEKDGGKLDVAADTAVSIMLNFAKQHPDFGVAGTFYVNLTNPFPGSGTPAQRLQFLVDHGFELGNHTWAHENLSQITAAQVQSTMARQAADVARLVPNYQEQSMALPFGAWPKEHRLAWEGESQGVKYKYGAVLLVGAEPAPSPYVTNFDPLALPRVQGTDTDNQMQMWLSNLKTTRYISDGDPNVVMVPKAKALTLKADAVAPRQVLSY